MMRALRFTAAALAMLLVTSVASAATVGVGGFGGVSVPVVQDDNGQGSIFGIRVPVNLVPLVTVEPYFASTSGGDKDQTIGSLTYTRSGIDVTTFGANVLLTFGTGLQLYPYVGIGSAKSKRSGLDATSTAYNFGLGLGFSPPIAKLSVHVRGELANVLDADVNETARKWANLTVGVSYGLLSFPPAP